MPTTDRATLLHDILSRLYPELDATGYLNDRAPGLYDRLIGGKEDMQSFGELATLFPNFWSEYSRYQRGLDAHPDPRGLDWSYRAGLGMGSEGEAPAPPSDVSGYDPGAFNAFLGVFTHAPIAGQIAQGAQFGNSLPAVQSFMSDAFPLTNAQGETVYGVNPLQGNALTNLFGQLTGINLAGLNTAYMTEGQLADADGGIGGLPASMTMGAGGLSGLLASLAAGAEFGDAGGEGFAGTYGPGLSPQGDSGMGGGAVSSPFHEWVNPADRRQPFDFQLNGMAQDSHPYLASVPSSVFDHPWLGGGGIEEAIRRRDANPMDPDYQRWAWWSTGQMVEPEHWGTLGKTEDFPDLSSLVWQLSFGRGPGSSDGSGDGSGW